MVVLRTGKMPSPPVPTPPPAPAPVEGLPPVFAALGAGVPLGIMVRGLLEWLLDDAALEGIQRAAAPEQYTREITLATLAKLLIQVCAGNRASLHAAWHADVNSPAPTVTTSHQALYGKLARMNPKLSEEVVRHAARRLADVIRQIGAAGGEPLLGYVMRVLDGNVLTGTDRRLGPLRNVASACLPGKSLVVYEPGSGLATDLVLCEDAYTQERVLLTEVVARLVARDLLVADRNFCTPRFVFGVSGRGACFIVRQHAVNLKVVPAGKYVSCGRSDTGTIWERPVRATDPETGATLWLRQVQVRLDKKTRNGERNINLLTNLPADVPAKKIAALYRERWTVEKHFQFLTDNLHCEQPGLGRPAAALFAFAMALTAANALAVVRAALRSAHGADTEAGLSGHYLADEVAADFRPVDKLVPPGDWAPWRALPATGLARVLEQLAARVRTGGLKKHPRGAKKPAGKRLPAGRHKHRSTARLLAAAAAGDPC